MDEALQIATINGAYASYEENLKGSITVGKLADFVILDKDPHEVDPDTIKQINVSAPWSAARAFLCAREEPAGRVERSDDGAG